MKISRNRNLVRVEVMEIGKVSLLENRFTFSTTTISVIYHPSRYNRCHHHRRASRRWGRITPVTYMQDRTQSADRATEPNRLVHPWNEIVVRYDVNNISQGVTMKDASQKELIRHPVKPWTEKTYLVCNLASDSTLCTMLVLVSFSSSSK